MPTSAQTAARREELQNAIYSRFNSQPDVADRIPLYTDVFLLAGYAADAVLELEARRAAESAQTNAQR